jgi:hypothetical protein
LSFEEIRNLTFNILNFFILNTKDNLDKFDSKFDVGIFLGCSSSSKSHKVHNNRTLCLEESIYVTFEETQK